MSVQMKVPRGRKVLERSPEIGDHPKKVLLNPPEDSIEPLQRFYLTPKASPSKPFDPREGPLLVARAAQDPHIASSNRTCIAPLSHYTPQTGPIATFLPVPRTCIASLLLWLASRPRTPRHPKSFRDTKSDSKVTPGRWPQSESDSKVAQMSLLSYFESLSGRFSHFWVTFRSLWGRCPRVTFESLLVSRNDLGFRGVLGREANHKSAVIFEIITFLTQKRLRNGNSKFWKVNSSDFEDGNWEPMEMKGPLWTPGR